MKVVIISGSPGAGKTSVSNGLSEKFRENNISHAILDPDETSRVFPETEMSNIKWLSLGKMYSVFKEHGVDKLIIPVTIDDDNDLVQIKKNLPYSKIRIIDLKVDIDLLKSRVIKREPNKYRQDTLVKLIEAYSLNGSSRTFDVADINVGDDSVDILVMKVFNMILSFMEE